MVVSHLTLHPSLKKRVAFTLAEVLITLGIIGVVAAMTLPTVINKADENIRKQQAKKAYSVLATAVQKAEYELGYPVKCNYGANNSWAECRSFHEEVAKLLKPIKHCASNALANGCFPKSSYKGGDEMFAENNPDKDLDESYMPVCGGFSRLHIERSPAYVFSDGMILFYYAGTESSPIFIVDVNGTKKPNKWGWDVFVFAIRRNSPTSGLKVTPDDGCIMIEKGGMLLKDFLYN